MSPETLPDLRAVQVRRKCAVAAFLFLLLTAGVVFGSAWDPGGGFRYLLEEGGLALILIAIVGRAWRSLYVGGRKKTQPVQQGPHALSRNPLHVFSFLGAIGVGAQTGSVVLTAACLAVTALIVLPAIAREEQALGQAFPADFPRYVRSTPRPIADFQRVPPHAPMPVNPVFFLRKLLVGLPLLLAWPLFDLVAWLHADVWPPLLRLY